MGTFSQNFEMDLRGVDLGGLTCVPVPAKNLTATLAKKDGETLTLTITIEKTTEDAGRRLAEWAAQVFFESIINQLTYDIQEIAAPRRDSSSFSPASEESGHRAMIVGDQISAQDGAAVSISPSQSQLEAIKKCFEFGLTIRPFAPAATLDQAKGMFFIGMESENRVVRFLIMYSALLLVVPFKDSATEPLQEELDQLLLKANPTLPFEPTGKPRSGKPKKETLYTKLRNDFIHAEKRGCDPTAAIEAIEQNIAAFQRDVAKVLT